MSTVEPPREDRPEWRETDEWIVPADLKRPPAASVEAPVSDAQPEPAHAPALTVHGPTAALRALRRDGGESHA